MSDEEALTPAQLRERALARRQAREQPQEVDQPVEEPRIEAGAFSYGSTPAVRQPEPGPQPDISLPPPMDRPTSWREGRKNRDQVRESFPTPQPAPKPQGVPNDPSRGGDEPADQWYPGMPTPQKPKRRWWPIVLLAIFVVPPITAWLAGIGLGAWFIVLCVITVLLYLGLRSQRAQDALVSMGLFSKPATRATGLSILGLATVITLVVVGIEQPWKVEFGPKPIKDLQAGDCILYPSDYYRTATMRVVSCAEPHSSQVVAMAYPAQPGPWSIGADTDVIDQCRDTYLSFTGGEGAELDPELEMQAFPSDQKAWEDGKTMYACVLGTSDESLAYTNQNFGVLPTFPV